MDRCFVAYYRVSTQEQGRSGLGLDAQRQAVTQYLAGGSWELVGEYTDIESGKRDDRPELLRAIAHARRSRSTLVIAKLDRLSRKVSFVSSLMESGVKFVAADNPSANELTIHILAAVAQAERKAIGERTRAALAAAKKRGQKLGNPRIELARTSALDSLSARARHFAETTLPTIRHLQSCGCKTLSSVADALNARAVPAARGGTWTATAVRRVLSRAPLDSLGTIDLP